ncbi:MAG: hypothetical protein IPI00_03430 [Flavobacteriales bacterium]|nr:hypothetical protein [Flavobacteriales bacterium]
MKHLILGLTACTLSLSSMAQQAPRPCGTDLERQRLIETYPDYLQMEAEAEAEMRELLRNSGNERDENTLYTIPIVFHIIHLNGRENISNEQDPRCG